MEVSMDNKYGLGGAKVATAHHQTCHKQDSTQALACRFCHSVTLMLCPTLDDHYCKECGQYQSDVPLGYSTGHSADY
jgi:hypothetical protein